MFARTQSRLVVFPSYTYVYGVIRSTFADNLLHLDSKYRGPQKLKKKYIMDLKLKSYYHIVSLFDMHVHFDMSDRIAWKQDGPILIIEDPTSPPPPHPHPRPIGFFISFLGGLHSQPNYYTEEEETL